MNAPRLVDDLGHIVQAIDRIDRFTAGLDEAGFRAHDMAHDAVIRNLEVIGEACRNIERERPDFAAARPELPLGQAYAMRNAQCAEPRLLQGRPGRGVADAAQRSAGLATAG